MILRLGAALVLIGAAGTGLAAAKQHVAERFEVTASVRADGSLDVVEEIAFRFTGGTFTEVTRELRASETDGIEVLEASMDGRTLPRGDEEGQVEVDAGSRRARIKWRFAPTTDRVHVFTLRYRYAGVVSHGDGEDGFRWPPFPSSFDYPIDNGGVRLTWPSSARLRREPLIEGPVTSASPLDNGLALTVANYRQRDDDVRVTVRFEPGAFPGREPEWQQDARRAAGMAPAFMAAAAMIAAATVLAMLLFFLRYRREGREGPLPAGSVSAPPDDLPAAVAGAITSGRLSASWPQLMAAVFELARRGVLLIEQDKAAGFLKKHKFTLRRGRDGSLLPHERAVVDALFKGKEETERFDRALLRLNGRAGKVGRAIESELAAARLIDAERKEGGRALATSGGVVALFALLMGVLLGVTGMRLGEASMFVPAALGLSGFTMLITGAAFSTLSASGLRASRRWDGYRRHLKAEIKQGRVPSDGEAIGRLLPYASALGLLSAFGKALARTEVRNLPPWLRTLDAAGGAAAMIAVITAGSRSASHGTSGRSGAGGVGAGGSSSAR